MAGYPELGTKRLRLRMWRESDRVGFASINADPAVMEHFPGRLSREESDALVEEIEAEFEREGFGLWAVEVRQSREFVGFVGLERVPFDAHFTPAVEVGWRLAHSAWGNGYATEAGHAALAFGFERLGLEEIVSFTAVSNARSRAVMERLGMSHDPADNFDHPNLAPGDRLLRHVLYRAATGAA